MWDKQFRLKISILSPPLIHNFFRYQIFSETQNDSPVKIFGTVRQVSTENLDTPRYPSDPLIFSLLEFFRNTAKKGSSTKSFGTLRQKILDIKSWHNHLKHNKLLGTRKQWHTKGFLYESFWFCQIKSFRRKSMIFLSPPPPPRFIQ